MLLAAPAAAAEGSVTYVPGAGGDVVRNLAGAAYLVLVGVFIARLLRKRANSSLTQARHEVSHTGTACRPTSPTLTFYKCHPLAAEPSGCRVYLVPVGNFHAQLLRKHASSFLTQARCLCLLLP